MLRSGIALSTALALTLAQLPLAALLAAPALAQSIMSRAEYEACQANDEPGFRRAIEALTLKGLQAGIATIDYRAVVTEEWRRIGMDELIDKQVDQSVAEVTEETSWGRLIQSLASKDKAQELATSVAERVYKSEAMRRALETLAGGVGKAIGKRIEVATADTAEPAMQCIQAFLGARYGATVARVVARDAGSAYVIDPAKAGSEVSTGQVLAEGAGGITGAVILLVRRQLAGMASRVGARVVGSVIARLVSVVAGGVGIVLIAKDIWDFRHGVMPIVATEMKSRATKDKVQDELAGAIREQIVDNLRDIAAKTADRVVDIWQEFRRAHAKVVAFAESNDKFKRFLDGLKPEALGRLDEIVGLVVASEGEAGVLRRLDDGSLNEAVNRLPAVALDIARETRSLEAALAWSTLAGDRLASVVEYEIHRRAKPEAFSKASLARLIGLNDKVAIPRLAALDANARTALLELDDAALRTLGRALTETELDSLARYQSALAKPAAVRVLQAVAQSPAKMQVLARVSVRDGILASRDQSAAVGMMLKADGIADIAAINDHVALVLDGRVAPVLLWEKHPSAVVTTGLVGLILLAMLKRLLFGRRPKVIVQHVPSAAAPPIRTRRS